MTALDTLAAIQQELADLEHISFVAHRDTKEALAAIEQQGDDVALVWTRACKACSSMIVMQARRLFAAAWRPCRPATACCRGRSRPCSS
jgi:hypothetical protein